MLFCGMGDGKLISFRLDVGSIGASSTSPDAGSTIAIVETSRKSVVLGKKPLLLSLFATTAPSASTISPTAGESGATVDEASGAGKVGGGVGGQIETKHNLLVSSDRPTIVSFVASKLVFSTVNLSVSYSPSSWFSIKLTRFVKGYDNSHRLLPFHHLLPPNLLSRPRHPNLPQTRPNQLDPESRRPHHLARGGRTAPYRVREEQSDCWGCLFGERCGSCYRGSVELGLF